MNDIYINNPKLLERKISEEIFNLVENDKQVKNFKNSSISHEQKSN